MRPAGGEEQSGVRRKEGDRVSKEREGPKDLGVWVGVGGGGGVFGGST